MFTEEFGHGHSTRTKANRVKSIFHIRIEAENDFRAARRWRKFRGYVPRRDDRHGARGWTRSSGERSRHEGDDILVWKHIYGGAM